MQGKALAVPRLGGEAAARIDACEGWADVLRLAEEEASGWVGDDVCAALVRMAHHLRSERFHGVEAARRHPAFAQLLEAASERLQDMQPYVRSPLQ